VNNLLSFCTKILNDIPNDVNKALHDEDWSRPLCPWLKVYQQVDNYKVAKHASEVSNGTTKTTVLIRWHAYSKGKLGEIEH
jgi:hypothetical protein